MSAYKNTDKIISHLNEEIEACGNPDGNNEPISYGTMLGLISAKAFIETAETADVQEVKHGRWIGKPISGYADCRCSVCGVVCNVRANAGTLTQRYCYACGAKMDGEE